MNKKDYVSHEETKKIINDFDKEHMIKNIILIGFDDEIRHIVFDVKSNEEN